MLFGSTAPLPALILWCRALRHGLDVGLSPVRVFRQQATSGPAALRPVADRLADRMDTGESLEDALRPEAGRFPTLFREMVAVGELAGRLPDVFALLERHYEAVREARKRFYLAITWPAISYFGAIATVALMLLILGLIAPTGQKPFDPFGMGLTGVGGAITFLIAAGSFTGFVVGAYLYVMNNEPARAKAEAFGLNVPWVSQCVRAFALHRFSMAAHMTIEAGMRADRVLRSSFRATANQAYTVEADRAAKMARKGNAVVDVIASCGTRLFPDEFVHAVTVGEESGRLAEVLQKESEHYGEEATRRMKTLASAAGGAVYAAVGVMIVVMIFRFYLTYFGMIDQAASGDLSGF